MKRLLAVLPLLALSVQPAIAQKRNHSTKHMKMAKAPVAVFANKEDMIFAIRCAVVQFSISAREKGYTIASIEGSFKLKQVTSDTTSVGGGTELPAILIPLTASASVTRGWVVENTELYTLNLIPAQALPRRCATLRVRMYDKNRKAAGDSPLNALLRFSQELRPFTPDTVPSQKTSSATFTLTRNAKTGFKISILFIHLDVTADEYKSTSESAYSVTFNFAPADHSSFQYAKPKEK